MLHYNQFFPLAGCWNGVLNQDQNYCASLVQGSLNILCFFVRPCLLQLTTIKGDYLFGQEQVELVEN